LDTHKLAAELKGKKAAYNHHTMSPCKKADVLGEGRREKSLEKSRKLKGDRDGYGTYKGGWTPGGLSEGTWWRVIEKKTYEKEEH